MSGLHDGDEMSVCGMFAAALLAVSLPMLGSCQSEADKREAACNDVDSAYKALQKIVASKLRAPATAEFPQIGASGVKAERAKGCRQYIESYVDAQNVFGANVRVRFFAFMELKGEADDWTEDVFTFADQRALAGAVID